MLPRLEGYATAVLTDVALEERLRIADDLDALELTVESRPDLKAALTDTSMSGPVRAAVLRDLLDGRLGAPAVRLAAFGASVATAPDTPGTIGELARYARVRSRRDEYTAPALSLMRARRRVTGFADGVLETLAVSAFDAIEDDLFRWARTIEANLDLRRIMVDRDAVASARADLTRRLLSAKVGAPTLRIAVYAVEGGRARDVVGTLDALVDYVARARDWRVARVWAARDIPSDDRTTLVSSLRTLAGHEVELRIVPDAHLLGGIVVQIGDLRLDASTRGRLEALRETFDAHHLQLHPTT